jgi:hypothetical protein
MFVGPAGRNLSFCWAGLQNSIIIISCTVVEALHCGHDFAKHIVAWRQLSRPNSSALLPVLAVSADHPL